VVGVQELVALRRSGLVKRCTIRIRIRAATVYTAMAISAAQKVVWPTAWVSFEDAGERAGQGVADPVHHLDKAITADR
jgi:hypothetical protein